MERFEYEETLNRHETGGYWIRNSFSKAGIAHIVESSRRESPDWCDETWEPSELYLSRIMETLMDNEEWTFEETEKNLARTKYYIKFEPEHFLWAFEKDEDFDVVLWKSL